MTNSESYRSDYSTIMEANVQPTENPLPWYAIYTRSRAERKVYQYLLEKSEQQLLKTNELFLPQYRVTSRWSDRLKEIKKPLFPGYLFIQIYLSNETWREVIITPGVANVLHSGKIPIPIPQDEIDTIKKLLRNEKTVPYTQFKPGKEVQVTHGPLKGVIGTLLDVHQERASLIVNFPILGRAVRTQIKIWDCRPLNP